MGRMATSYNMCYLLCCIRLLCISMQRSVQNAKKIYEQIECLSGICNAPCFTGGFIGWIGNVNVWNRLYDIKYSVLTSSLGWKSLLVLVG